MPTEIERLLRASAVQPSRSVDVVAIAERVRHRRRWRHAAVGVGTATVVVVAGALALGSVRGPVGPAIVDRPPATQPAPEEEVAPAEEVPVGAACYRPPTRHVGTGGDWLSAPDMQARLGHVHWLLLSQEGIYDGYVDDLRQRKVILFDPAVRDEAEVRAQIADLDPDPAGPPLFEVQPTCGDPVQLQAWREDLRRAVGPPVNLDLVTGTLHVCEVDPELLARAVAELGITATVTNQDRCPRVEFLS